jgi:hypothetical protein
MKRGLPQLMASQKVANCCVARPAGSALGVQIFSSLRRTYVRLIPRNLRALHLTIFA